MTLASDADVREGEDVMNKIDPDRLNTVKVYGDAAKSKNGDKSSEDPKVPPHSKKRKASCNDESKNDERSTNENQPSHVFNGMIEFPIEPLKSHLICYSCKGYFREPYTVAECLHTFCKSCLFLKFHSGVRKCPRCEISLDPDPYKAVLSDRTLQELLDKIFPELKEMDEEKELEFYKERGIDLKDNITVEDGITKSDTSRTRGSKQSQLTQSNIVKRSDHVPGTGRSYSDTYQQSSACRSTGDDKLTSIPVDEINFKLIPDKDVKNPMNSLQKEIVRTSGQLKVAQIKKYLIEKLQLSSARPNVDVLCNGDPLGDELSLTFIQRTRWLHPSLDLCLHYRLGEDGAY